MPTFIRFLAESDNYKVYSEHESVYLIDKNKSSPEDPGMFITCHSGDPNCAIILPSEKYIIVAGCGLSIYDVEKKEEIYILAEKDNISWVEGLYQSMLDDQNNEFRFVTENSDDKLRVFRYHIKTHQIEQIDE